MPALRSITIDELDNLQLDGNNQLHWDGKKVVVHKKVSLRGYELFLATIVALAGAMTGLETLLKMIGKCSLI